MFEPLHLVQTIACIWYIAVYLVRIFGFSMHVIRSKFSNSEKTNNVTLKRINNEGVTILRPLKGVNDSDLYECLKSTFVQSYSPIQILLCVSDPGDKAIPLATQVMSEFPHVNADLLIGPDVEYGVNPKVNNLVKGYKKAMYDIIWAIDSNIKVHPDALSRAMPLFDSPRVGLVHHLPIAVAKEGTGWGGILDETYMLTAHSTFYSGINFVGIAPCVTGKSNIYRRSKLDRSVNAEQGCGLEAFSSYMAEDQMISDSLWQSGSRTAMAPDAAIQPLGAHINLKEFWMRRARWIRVRKNMVISATLVEPFTDCFFHNIFISVLFQLRTTTFLLLCLLWCALDWVNYKVLFTYTGTKSRPLGKWLFSWLVRELLAFPLWLWAMSGRQIWWRNRPYKIKRDLTAETVD